MERIITGIRIHRLIKELVFISDRAKLIKKIRRHRKRITITWINENRIIKLIRIVINTFTNIITSNSRNTERIGVLQTRFKKFPNGFIIIWI